MNIKYKKSESNIRPDSMDTISSKESVYLRKNIKEEQRDVKPEGVMTVYTYDEAKLTKKEYEQYQKNTLINQTKQQRADIDYIALMSGIDLGDGNE